MKFDLELLFGTILGILIILCTIQLHRIHNLEIEVVELRTLFNQKFLQEMVVNEPDLRDLSYREENSSKTLVRFEF
jgi:hypothetical protein